MEPTEPLAQVVPITGTETPDEKMHRQIDEMHAAIIQIRDSLSPALEQLSSGGIMSLLMGRKG